MSGINLPKELESIKTYKPPANFRQWILKEATLGRYMFFSKKDNTAKCSYCGKVHKLSELTIWDPNGECRTTHGKLTTCPSCREEAMMKSLGMGTKCLTEETMTMIFIKKNRSVYGILFDIDIIYKDGEPDVLYAERAIYKINKKERVAFRRTYSWYWISDNGWEKLNKFRIPWPQGTYYYSVKREGLYLYRDNLNTVLLNNPLFEYTGLKEFYNAVIELHFGVDGNDDGIAANLLLNFLEKTFILPAIEKLCKTGFFHIVKDKIEGRPGSRAINWKATSLSGAMRLNKNQIQEAKDAGLCMRSLEIYKAQLRDKNPVTPDQAYELHCSYRYSELRKLTKELGVSLSKIMTLIDKDNKRWNRHSRISDYVDYIDECKKLKYSLEDKSILYPKSFSAAHSRTSEILRAETDRKLDENIKKHGLKITGLTKPYVDDNLILRVAQSIKELAHEGDRLNHCVHGYGDRMAEGRCAILFVRRKSDPDTPFYTLEVNKKCEFIQCRGDHNCITTDEVKEFVDAWLAEVKSGKNKNKKSKAKRSKVA